MIDLNAMRLFAQVVEAGSFTAAARELSMPKSTLSRRITQLESELDCRLLQRTTRSLRLTDLGADFYSHCQRMVAEAKEAEQAISRGQEIPRGLLRVTAPVEFGIDLLGALAAEYLQRYPDVTLELDLSNRFVDLIEEGFDLALRAGRLEDSSLIARRLGESRLTVSASPAYLARRGSPTTPKQLTEHDCLVYPGADGRCLLQFSGPNQMVQVELQGRLVANSLGTLRDAAIAGLGIAALPLSLCREALEQGRLQPVLEDWLLPTDGIYAVYPSPRHLTPKLQSFMEFVAQRL
jgi:DNA-binding transcriptional LysR family regulator